MQFTTRPLLLCAVVAAMSLALSSQAAPVPSASSLMLAERDLLTEPLDSSDLIYDARDFGGEEEMDAAELLERGFGKKLFGGLKKVGRVGLSVASNFIKRDADFSDDITSTTDLYMRDLAAGYGSDADADEMFARDLLGDDTVDELLARGFGKKLLGGLKKAGRVGLSVASNFIKRDLDDEADEQDFYIRDLLEQDSDEADEMFARELLGDEEVDQLLARGFGKKLLHGLGKAAKVGVRVASNFI